MSNAPPAKKKILDLVILTVLVGVAGFQVYSRLSRGEGGRNTEDDLLLIGLEPESARIPGRSVMGETNHDRLTETVSARKDQLSDLELMGLMPDVESSGNATAAQDPVGTAPPVKNPAADPPEALVKDGPPVDDVAAPLEASPEPVEEPVEPVERVEREDSVPPEADPEPEPSSTEGIWVRSSREGSNPIRVEDHVSVDAKQLAEMAGFRNISTDMRYPPPRFNISGVGSGRLGTYVIVDHQMIRMNGQINAPTSPPRAWRLVEASANEVFWEPVE
ncbi:MAG: hypothetical protein JJU05_10240 [Verrucomicrobia bacterium]|nr:hypothetical protein [Verrucomicrobiota bacterium]MCH8527088.1 hypothetical protein [Kiritimatiellia bacterium]